MIVIFVSKEFLVEDFVHKKADDEFRILRYFRSRLHSADGDVCFDF